LKVQRGSIFRPEKNYYRSAGIILIVAVIQFFIAINLAEMKYPNYSASINMLSDLGGSLPPVEPSATIFNFSIIILGILLLAAVYLVLKSGGCRLFSSSLILAAIGAVGVGLFPSYTGAIHNYFAVIIFIFGSLAAIFSYRLGLNIPMVLVSMILGFLSLFTTLSLVIWSFSSNPMINYWGGGGTERIIIYPVLLYLIALGGYLTSRGEDWVRLKFTG
jgi:hypothetical membrane protein